MAVDPFLYVAFLVGLVAGRLIRRRTRWVERATVGTVVVLLLLLGASLSDIPFAQIVDAIPDALLFLVLLVALTLGLVYVLVRAPPAPAPVAATPARRFPIELVFAGSLLVGYGVLGRLAETWDPAIEWALYALLALVAFDLRLSRRALRSAWVPLTAAIGGATLASVLMTLAVGIPIPVSAATAFGFGWYTLAGPLVAAKVGPALGLVAFLTNFLRENVTMLTAARLGPRFGGMGIAAVGGATSMDTTLYFAARYGGADSGSMALGTGLVLTISAGVLLPILLSLPGA